MAHRLNQRQEGFVSIIVAMFIMIFVTLLALGFAFLAQQNAEQNQNRTLSTQAFYAAESGVNDAVNYMTNFVKANNGALPPDKTDCNQKINNIDDTIGSVNDEVKYTCVLYDSSPFSLEYTISNKQSTIIRVQAKNGVPLQSIKISWQSNGSGSTQFASATNKHLLPETDYTGTDSMPLNQNSGENLALSNDVLRATLIPTFGSMNRADLTTKAQTLFLYPKVGGTSSVSFIGSANPSDPNQGVFVDGNCSSPNSSQPRFCNATITGLNTGMVASATNTFYLRLRGFYRSSTSVAVTAKLVNGNDAELINEQAVVDSTGKANNVLRRIQVRVPLSASTNRPEFAIETTDGLCKLLQVRPNDATIGTVPGGGPTPESCKAFN